MAKYIITGDIHGTLDIEKVVRFFEEHGDEYTEDDYLIICGDVGVCGFNPDIEKETRQILRELPVTVLFIDGTRFFTFGGAYSVDRYARTEGVDWFPEEIPSREEYEEGLDNLEKCGYRIDYIITHTAPFEVAAALGYGEASLDEVALRRYLQQIADEAEYNLWFFGHFHEDEVIEDVFIAMYDEIVVAN